MPFAEDQARPIQDPCQLYCQVGSDAALDDLPESQPGQENHRITGVDPLSLSPDRPHCAPMPTPFIAILNIIMDQREVVHELYRGSNC